MIALETEDFGKQLVIGDLTTQNEIKILAKTFGDTAALLNSFLNAPKLIVPTLSPTRRNPVGECEVCMYIVENQHDLHPYLCQGLEDSLQQEACKEILESLMWWVENQVYWNVYGCLSIETENRVWVQPCPPAAVCGWLQKAQDAAGTFCPPSIVYEKPH